jgi:hypothetical protein
VILLAIVWLVVESLAGLKSYVPVPAENCPRLAQEQLADKDDGKPWSIVRAECDSVPPSQTTLKGGYP